MKWTSLISRRRITLALLALTLGLTTLSCAHAFGSTPLIDAAMRGNTQKAQRLVDGGADVNQATRHGWTPLMVASKEGHRSIVESLLKAGADVKLVSQRITGNTQAPVPATTALREALRGGHAAIARLLIDAGAPVDETAVSLAGGIDDLELLQALLEDGGDPNSALSLASRKGLTKNVAWLLENGADLDPKALGALPLRTAVNADQLEVVKLLLAKGADPNVPYSLDQATPLLHCINVHTRAGRFDPKCEMVKVLLENGANREYRSPASPYQKRNALEFAKSKRDWSAQRMEKSKYYTQIVNKLDVVIGMLEKRTLESP